MRYFISYENYKDNCKLDKKINISSNELKLIYNKGDNEYIIKPLYLFEENIVDLDSYIVKIEEIRKNLFFMIELTEEEAKEVHPIFLKRFKDNKLTNPDKIIKLLRFDNDIINKMTYEEEEKIKSINLFSKEKDILSLSIKNNNKDIKLRNIGEGEYFYTEVKRILDKYNDHVVEIKEVDRNKYKLKKYRIIGIDSIGRDRLIGSSKELCEFYYNICHNSKVLYVSEEDNNYYISDKKDIISKKIFVVDNSVLSELLISKHLDELKKYINIYELNDSSYKKIPFNEYNKELKYTKKPSIN